MFSSLKLHWALRRLSWHTSTPTSALRDRLVAMHQLLALHKEHQWNSIAHQVHPLADSSEVAKALRKNPRVHNVVSGRGMYPFSVYSKTKEGSGRPHQVWRYDHSCHSDVMIFEEQDESCAVDISLTRDGEYLTINSNSRNSSEVWLMRSHDLSHDPELVRGRRPNVEYFMEHAHNRFYVLTNTGTTGEYQLMFAESANPELWQLLYKPENGMVLQDLEVFCDHVIVYGTRHLVPVVVVLSSQSVGESVVMRPSGSACWIEKFVREIDFKSKNVPIWWSSPFQRPNCTIIRGDTPPWTSGGCEISGTKASGGSELPPETSTSGGSELSRVQTSGGCEISGTHTSGGCEISGTHTSGGCEISGTHTSGGYTMSRTKAINEKDGVQIPITLCYHGDAMKSGNGSPLLVHAYGCYGESLYLGYRPEYEQLLSMGWVLAFCHVRGGGERGRRWHREGQGEKKMNTFLDLHACVKHLQSQLRLSLPSLTAMTGRSAGGQTVGMFCNLWPHLLQAAILQVPYVDVRETLASSSDHFAIMDHEELGYHPGNADCNEVAESMCPFSTLRPQDYPSFYITASRHDPIIPFKGVQRYASKLQQCVLLHRSSAGGHRRRSWRDVFGLGSGVDPLPRGTVLFRELRHQGHYLSSDITKECHETALQVTFLHRALGLPLKL